MSADVPSPSVGTRSPGSTPGSSEGGFALAVVLVLLFAIGVAGATSYQVVRTEAAMSVSARQGSQALAAARAGLERFIAEQRGVLPVERTYAFGDARAVVTPRLVRSQPYHRQRYLIRSVGTVVDPRYAGNAAERTVFQMVDHHRTAVTPRGALMSPSTHIDIDGSATAVSGVDAATSADCGFAPTADVAGVVGGGTIHVTDGASVTGTPSYVSYPGEEATLDSLGLDWDVVTDPSFPVEHDGTWPSFGTIPSDSFPAIRWNGNFDAYYYMSGRGILIVTQDLRFHSGFAWNGIILANDMLNTTSAEDFTVRGLLAVGMDGVGEAFTYSDGGDVRYHSCNAVRAGRALAHLEPIEGSWWEAY